VEHDLITNSQRKSLIEIFALACVKESTVQQDWRRRSKAPTLHLHKTEYTKSEKAKKRSPPSLE
jgi:hypothetical protein